MRSVKDILFLRPMKVINGFTVSSIIPYRGRRSRGVIHIQLQSRDATLLNGDHFPAAHHLFFVGPLTRKTSSSTTTTKKAVKVEETLSGQTKQRTSCWRNLGGINEVIILCRIKCTLTDCHFLSPHLLDGGEQEDCNLISPSPRVSLAKAINLLARVLQPR